MMDMTGQIIGSYRIESLLGSGGMGQVFRASHVRSNQPAAVKILDSRHVTDRAFRARFLQEARAAADLTHPNIIDVLDFGEDQGRFYVVTELVPDGSLRALQQQLGPREPLPPYLGIDLVRQAAEGLAYAHRLHMVHGGIKPDNLLLERVAEQAGARSAYEVKLTDFGLAHLAEDGTHTSDDIPATTFAYMSPEQCQGFELDGRSDIYSLGVVLFEAATGVVPFEARTLSGVAFNHVHTPPPSPREIRPDIPEPLAAVIMRCLAKDPAQRFSSADELAATLTGLIPADSPAPGAASSSLPGQGNVEGVRIVLDRNTVPVIPGQPATVNVTLINQGDAPARAMLTLDGLAPDLIRLPPGVVDLPPRGRMSGPIHVLIPRTPASAAGEYLSIIRVHIPGQPAPASDAQLRVSVEPFGATRLDLEPPVVTGRGRGAYRVTMQNLGNETRQVTPAAADEQGALRFDFSPAQLTLEPGQQSSSRLTVRGQAPLFHGRREPHHFTVTASSSGSGGDDRTPPVRGTLLQNPQYPIWALPVLVLMLLAGGAAVAAFWPDNTDPSAASATATVETDGAAVAGQTEPATAGTPAGDDPANGAPEQDDEPGDTDSAGATEGVADPPTLAPDALIAFSTGRGADPNGTLDIYVMHPDGSNQRGLITDPGDDWSPAWSNDGTRIAWVGKGAGHDEIFVANADGSDRIRLSSGSIDSRFPLWSPDDNWIIFARGHDNETELFVVSSNGDEPIQLTDNTAFDGNPSWSPDSSRIAFTSNRTGSNEIFIMNIDGSDVRQLTNTDGNNFNPAWSPDGERIMFTSDRNSDPGGEQRNRDVYVIDVDGTQEAGLAVQDSDEHSPAWSPDGSHIAFARTTENDEADLFIMQADGAEERLVASGVFAGDPNLTWSPDGDQIAFLRLGDAHLDIYVVLIASGDVIRLTTNPTFDGNITWRAIPDVE